MADATSNLFVQNGPDADHTETTREDSRVNMTRTVQDADNSVVYFFVDVTKMNETFVLDVEPRMPDP